MKEIILNNDVREIHIPLIFSNSQEAQDAFANAKTVLEKAGATIVSLEVSAGSFADSAVENFTIGAEYPINRILPLDEVAEPILAGAHITAVVGTTPKFASTPEGDRAVMYSDGAFEYCRTFGVVSMIDNDKPFEHTLDNLNRLENALKLFGFTYNDIARTWFYNEDILSWYDDFNRARTQFYKERKIFDGLLPASTGIGAPNKAGQRMISGAIALKKIGDGKVYEIESPLQCGAPNYGSSFSRAIEIDTPASKRIMVSGTASIEPEGATVHIDDIERQVDLTMRVIEAILLSRGMNFDNTIRAVIYCLRPEYYNVFQKWMAKNTSIASFPSYSIVCRGDLLFEVELESYLSK